MTTITGRLRRQIAAEQHAIGEHLHELETRVRDVGDWRVQVDRRPLVVLGLAFGGGVALSALVGKRRRRRRQNAAAPLADGAERAPAEPSASSEAWRRFKGALLATVAVQAAEVIGEVLPGFRDEFTS